MSPHRRITDPVEAMAHRVAERVVDLVLNVVDLNAIIKRVDGTAVVYSWDARAARLRFLAREAELARIPPGG